MQIDTFIHEYPLPFVHEGTMLGNGILGLYAWGAGNHLNITVGSSQVWDHRGGMSWTPKQNYAHIRQALLDKDMDKIKEIFAPDTENQPGQPKRPSIIPVGRIEFTLPEDCELLRNELNRLDGGLKIIYSCNGQEKAAELRLDMTRKGSFALKCEDVEAFNVRSSYELTIDSMAEISFEKPIVLSREDMLGFIQPMPADPAFAMAVMHSHDLFTAEFRRGKDLVQLKTDLQGETEKSWENLGGTARETLLKMLPGLTPLDWEKLVKSNTDWWSAFWRDVPSISVDSPLLNDIYYDGLFKFASMTTPDGYPAGLQGPWIEDYSLPPWSGDYHFNINVEMCYWPAYRANRLANLKTLFDMVWSWRDILRQNAKNYIGVEDGYMLPHAVDDRCTCMGSFWTGTIDHACTAWVAQMMYDYVDYSGDFQYLKDVVFDFMKGTMKVFYAMLERRDGRLVLPVSVSPEYRGSQMDAWGENASFQLAAFHRLADNLMKAAKILGVAEEPSWSDVAEHLPKASLAPCGNNNYEIALWDGTVLEESHRHHSHMAGLCPFDIIDPEDPQWRSIVANTVRRWLYHGMGLWSGWCVPWAAMINNRLDNGDAAELMLQIWRKTYNNPGGGSLHDAAFRGFTLMVGRPQIMQMDGAMGALTAVQDMFLHSRQGVLHIFAGVSALHRKVSFEGMPAPGGFKVSAWREPQVSRVRVTAFRDNTLKLVFHGPTGSKVKVQTERQEFHLQYKRMLSIGMVRGETLTLDFI